MSDHVIITGVRRANEFVPVTELKQMAGRVGRTQDGKIYSADIILTDDDYRIENEMSSDEKYDAVSRFNVVTKFAFHVLPKIVDGKIYDRDGLQNFFNRSLCSFQGNKIELDKVISYLISKQAIDENFHPLLNGDIAASMYMSVGDVKAIQDNFTRVINEDPDSDGAIAWALGNLETIRIHGDFGEHRQEIDIFKENLPGRYDCEEGTVLTSALWWCMLGRGVAGKNMATNVRLLKKHFGRISLVMERLGFNKSYVNDLSVRIYRNVDRELLPFFSLPNMTKARASALKWMGYNGPEGTENVEIEE